MGGLHIKIKAMKTYPYSKIKGKSKIATGSLLLAQPVWPEEIYEHSAILILDHSLKGTTGVMLNKMSNLNVAVALPELDISNTLYFGGPADITTICYLHSNADVPGAVFVRPNLFWGGDYNFMKDLINERRFSLNQIKFFAGVVRWSSGQLEYEINSNKWWLSDINDHEVFDISEKDLWTFKLLSAGHLYGLLNEVPDPFFN